MIRPDDTTISDDSIFLRALTQDDWKVPDEDRFRVSSVAFYTYRNEPGETSVYADTPKGREIFGRRFPDTPAARFTAQSARAAGFNITHDPDGDLESSPEHFVLTFNGEPRRKPYHRGCGHLALCSAFTTPEKLTATTHADTGSVPDEGQNGCCEPQ